MTNSQNAAHEERTGFKCDLSVNVLQCREDSEESESFNADGPRAGTYDACTANMQRLTGRTLFHEFKAASGGGADSAPDGINGSANPFSTARICQELGASDGKPGVDFGAADGKFLLAAAVNGSGHVIGFELPENKVHKMLFDAVVKRIRRKYEVNLDVEWIGQDIEEVPLTMLT